MRLIAVDVGLTCGFAVVEAGVPPITGSRKIPGNSSDLLGIACSRFGHLIKDLAEEYHPDALVLCRPFASLKFGIAPTRLLFGLFGMAHAVCYSRGLPIYELDESRVRDAFGVKPAPRSVRNPEKRRRILKANVLQACTDRRWYVTDDHAGDAMLAGAYQLGALDQNSAILSQPLFIAAYPADDDPVRIIGRAIIPKKKRRRAKAA